MSSFAPRCQSLRRVTEPQKGRRKPLEETSGAPPQTASDGPTVIQSPNHRLVWVGQGPGQGPVQPAVGDPAWAGGLD